MTALGATSTRHCGNEKALVSQTMLGALLPGGQTLPAAHASADAQRR
jgi:hypothetical protein